MKNPTKIKARLKFLTGKEAQLNKDAKGIGEAITANESKFPNLFPKAADGVKIINDYGTALAKANKAGVIVTEAKNTAKANVQDLMRNWASQVSIDSAGNMETFLMSGFTPRSTNVKPVSVTTPPAPKVTNSENVGDILLHARKMRGAHVYQFRYSVVNPATAQQSDWVILPPSATRTIVKGLAAAQTVYVSVQVTGVENVSDWSEITSFRVGIIKI